MSGTPGAGFVFNGRGEDLSMELARLQLLESTDFIFSPKTTNDDVVLLGQTARLLHAALKGNFPLDLFERHVARGRWSEAGKLAARVSDSCEASPADALAAALDVTFAPIAHVDLFSVVALQGAKASGASRRLHPNSLGDAILQQIKGVPSREQLVNLAAYGTVSVGRSIGADRNGSATAHLRRLARLQVALEAVASDISSLSNVMRDARHNQWKSANATAVKSLEKTKIKFGTTVDNPPAIADFLLMAVLPTCATREFSKFVIESTSKPQPRRKSR